MIRFKDIKISGKIISLAGLLLTLMLLLGGTAIWNMNSISVDSKTMGNEYLPEMTIANKLSGEIMSLRIAVRSFLLSGEEKYLEQAQKPIGEAKKAIESLEGLSAKATHLTKLKDALGHIKGNFGEYEKIINDVKANHDVEVKAQDTLDANAKSLMDNITQFGNSQEAGIVGDLNQNAPAAVIQERVIKLKGANDVISSIGSIRVAVFKSLAQRDYKLMQEALAYFDAINSAIDEVKTVTHLEENLRELGVIGKAAEAYKAAMVEMLNAKTKAEELGQKQISVGEQLVTKVDSLAAAAGEHTARMSEENQASIAFSTSVMIVGAIIALIIGIGLSLIIARNIANPIREMAGISKELATGNFAVDVHFRSKDEVGELADSYRMLIDKMNESFFEVNRAVSQVAAAAGQISQASQSLSSGATESAASLEEITASVTQIGAQAKANADNSTQSSQLTHTVRGAAERGNTEMGTMLTAIQQVCEDGQKIAKVVKMIDDIAFQTNVLSLNAAVEAARAGKHGRGFTVVADAVRSLANESATAAKETAALVEGTIKRMNGSLDIAGKTSQSLNEIVTNSVKAADLVGEIAAASNEQAQGVGQIGQGLSQLNQVTQQSSANSEETAATAEELSGQAEELRRLVSRFKLKGDSGQTVARPRYEESKKLEITAPKHGNGHGQRSGLQLPAKEKEGGKVVAATMHNDEYIALNDEEFNRY